MNVNSSHHIHLRPLEPEDLELLYTIENSPEMWDTSNSDALYSRYILKQYIANAPSFYESGNLRLIIELNKAEANSIPVGIVDLTNHSPLHSRAEVGIAILQQFRGLHIASEALALMEQIALCRFRIHTLHAFVAESNIACQRLFKSADYGAVAQLPQWLYLHQHYEHATLYVKVLDEQERQQAPLMPMQ